MELAEGFPVLADDIAWAEAQALLWEHGLGDGLPLVPPVRARLDAMLEGVREPERSYGQVVPLYGELTPAAVAYQCVLAGCEPAHLALVLTALEACLDDAFNLLGIATTTGTPAVAVVVHGPVVERLGLNASTNCLGPGNRANACIGRAVSLALRNIGGARAGVGDMATMGQPGKYGFCFAESREALLPPFSVRRGLGPEEDAVTVLGVSGTAEVLPAGQEGPEAVLLPVAVAMWSALAASGGGRVREPLEQIFLFPPELVRGVLGHGWDLGRIQAFLAAARPLSLDASTEGWRALEERGLCRAPAEVHPIVTGGPGVKMTHLPLWAGGTRPITRALRSL